MNAITLTSSPDADRLIEMFLSGRKDTTFAAYHQDLSAFATFLKADGIGSAAKALLSGSGGEANALVLTYLNAMKDEGRLQAATINRRLSGIRAMVKLARVVGLVNWHIEIGNVPRQAYRDTRGPGKEGVVQMLAVLEAAKAENPVKAHRDIALVRLLFDRGLRRGEVANLDIRDLDAVNSRVRIIGKGRTDPEWLTIAKPTFDAIADWLIYRGIEPGPLFINLDPVMPTGRLSDHAIYMIVCKLGKAIGRRVRPHGLRHAGITCALDRTNGNIRAVAKFARHRKTDTTALYDDNRQDVGGQIAAIVAD